MEWPDQPRLFSYAVSVWISPPTLWPLRIRRTRVQRSTATSETYSGPGMGRECESDLLLAEYVVQALWPICVFKARAHEDVSPVDS